jgi:hypothetical protein
MPKLQPPDLDSSGLTIDSHLALWTDFARDALHGILSFHGTHSSPKSIATLAAQVADEMLNQRAARRVAHKDAKEAERAKGQIGAVVQQFE